MTRKRLCGHIETVIGPNCETVGQRLVTYDTDGSRAYGPISEDPLKHIRDGLPDHFEKLATRFPDMTIQKRSSREKRIAGFPFTTVRLLFALGLPAILSAMTIACHHDHTFDLDLLKPGDWAFDVGCRGFDIPKQLALLNVNVIAYDADPNPSILNHLIGFSQEHRSLIRYRLGCAVIGLAERAQQPTVLLDTSANPYAFSLYTKTGDKFAEVPTTSLVHVLEEHGVKQLGLLKLDAEGAEYGIMEDVISLSTMNAHPARQITVEFHDDCAVPIPPPTSTWFDDLDMRMSLAGYDRAWPPVGVKHSHDSLFILRKEHWK